MTFLVDMNLSSRWVDFFADHDLHAVHWSSIGLAFDKDLIIFSYAMQHDCVVLTQDLDFGSMLARSREAKPSVIQLRAENAGPESLGAQVLDAIHHLEHELQVGALVTIEERRTRARILPFPGAAS